MSLTTTHLAGFCWLNSAAAATATATATATGTTITLTNSGTTSAGGSSSTITYTVPAGGIPSGSTIIMGAANLDSRTITGASDTKGNTYQVGIGQIGTFGQSAALVYSQNITALVSGDIITVNFSANAGDRILIVAYATGLTTGTLIDKNASASGTSSSPSSGATAVTSQASELVVGFVNFERPSPSDDISSEASGYTVIGNVRSGSHRLNLAYKVVSSIGAQTYAPTLVNSVSWACGVETLRAA